LKVLVIGAGGLGCELLKNLALTGFRNIDVIDLDTIDLSNLNRQFLFRQSDIGRPKAEVAAEFVMKRVPGVQITPHFGKIEDKEDEFYLQFNLIILGLDSLKARSWINDKICSLILWEDTGGNVCEPNDGYITPMIDGGSEGFKGHVRIINPTKTASFHSTLWMFPPQVAFPMCTIESTPRLPEHCVAYVKDVLWSRESPFGEGKGVDGDNPEHIQWITKMAQERAAAHGIEGVDYRFTQGVVKNIIPAIASTNAIVAAGCVNEAFKMATGCSKIMNNYMMYNGNSIDKGVYAHQTELLPEPDDPQAGPPLIIDCKPEWTVQDFIEKGLVGLTTSGGSQVTDASKVQLFSDEAKIRVTGALAALTASNDTKPIADFEPAGPLQHIYFSTPELGDTQAIFKLRLRFPQA
jgi:ubiquitin-activating enzyme E1 C